MYMPTFNDRLRQIMLLALIILIAIMLITELYIFLPGIMGGITLYIIGRANYFKLTFTHKWNKSLTAFLFIIAFIILIGLPVFFGVKMISPKINAIISNPAPIVDVIMDVSSRFEKSSGIELASNDNMQTITQQITSLLPKLLNSSVMMLTNLVMMFFLVYFLFVNGSDIEKHLSKVIPLKPANVDLLARETKVMIRANALGIPLISIVQGVFAALGYWIFGIKDWAMWGLITGIFAFFPIVGTMIIWVPLAISVYATGQALPALGLGLYSLIVTGNVDYIARITLMKKMGDVHPIVTVLGVIVGLSMFGFMGLIFGPLLVSYFIILVKIYLNEFAIRDVEE